MIRRHTRRFSRAVWLLLATSLAVPTTLLATATPAHATIPTVIAAETRVTDTDPMWTFDVVFTFDQNLDCSAAQTFYFNIAQFRDAALGGTGRQSGNTSSFDACAGQTGMAANQTVLHFDLLAAATDIFIPSGVDLDGNPLYNADGTPHISQAVVRGGLFTKAAGVGTTFFVDLPTPPEWVALGDGYSSQMYQTPDGCTTATTCYDPNNYSISWIGKAVEDINFNRIATNNANTMWNLQGKVVATDGATSATVAGTQTATMKNELAKHVIKRPTSPLGDLSSWNWVSVSAGLVDVGIPTVMQNYAITRFPYGTSTTVPWDPGTAANCPDLSGVLTSINGTTGSQIIPNLKTMANAVFATDVHAHIVQVLYPWLTEPTSPCNTTGAPGGVTNRAVMNALRTKTNITTDASLHNMIALDLQDPVHGFGDVPTGTLIAGNRLNSRLWLSRPYGYPYPSQAGVSAMKNAAVSLAGAAAADFTPPTVIGTPLEPSVGNGGQWWNSPTVHITWTATDDTGLALLPGTWVSQGFESSIATTEGSNIYQSPTQACDLSTPANCAYGYLSLAIDTTKPTATVSPDRDPDHNGWYNATGGDVTVTWMGDDTKYDADGNAILDTNGNPIAVSGVDYTTSNFPQPVIVSTNGANQLILPSAPNVCDLAQNCTPAPKFTLSIDQIAPTVTPVVTSAGSPSAAGWYNKSVTIGWTTGDQGGSGIDATASTTPGGTVTSGVQTYAASVSDVAGNVTTNSVTVRVDQTAPTVGFVTTAVAGATYGLNSVPAVDCAGSDQPTLSDWAGCTVNLTKGTVALDGSSLWTYTAVGADNAGNTTTTTMSFKVTGQQYDTTPPVITVPLSPYKVTKGSTTPYPVTAVDNIDGVVSVTCSPLSQYLQPGYTTITCTAVDKSGNRATTTFTALVDNTPPVITVPKSPYAVIQGTSVTYPVTAVDDIDGVVAVTCTPASKTLPIGYSTITCTASDKSGNTSTAKFTVVVGAWPGKGVFVVGDRNAAVGTTGYFWGSQWENHNGQSKSIEHDSFKGYADYVDVANHRWWTAPGNSSKPPDSVPDYVVVIITNDTHKTGSTISGSIVGYVIVKVDSSYWKAPGHLGYGPIVASGTL